MKTGIKIRALPKVTLLSDETAKIFFPEYKAAVKSMKDHYLLNKVSHSHGSNISFFNVFTAVLANMIMSKHGYHVATPAELEMVRRGTEFFEENRNLCLSFDTALVIRDLRKNQYYSIAKSLMKQIKTKGLESKFPLMIPLARLELVKDKEGHKGLGFIINDRKDIPIIHAPVLHKDGYFSPDGISEKTGLPKRISENPSTRHENRSFLSDTNCLVRLFLDYQLDLVGHESLSQNSNDILLVKDGAVFKPIKKKKLEDDHDGAHSYLPYSGYGSDEGTDAEFENSGAQEEEGGEQIQSGEQVEEGYEGDREAGDCSWFIDNKKLIK